MATKPKSLPPWLDKAKAEGAKEAKSGKMPSKPHEKGESKKFEAAEEAAMKKKNGGKIAANKGTATNPKAAARNKPSMAATTPGNTLHLKSGGKVRC